MVRKCHFRSLLALLAILAMSVGCRAQRTKPATAAGVGAAVGAGNYCTLVDQILWTSNRDDSALVATPSPPTTETFNIFKMEYV